MSLLGFDALGRLALGQLPKSNAIVLPAAAGSFAITGVAAPFKVSEVTTVGAFSIAGVSASFQVTENTAPGAFAWTGNAAPLSPGITAIAGAFTINGFPANEPIVELAAAGSFKITGAAQLIRTGLDYDFQQGGIGHLLYERERARQLAKITRKAPPPVDLRTAPTFKPIGSPPVAAPAPVAQPSELQNQRTAALASAAAMKRRRQAAAVLLLAS
jgi:hypothetical protein